MHGGSVSAASEGPGRGSEFVVHLPAMRPEERPARVESPSNFPKSSPSGARRILIVDDNEDGADLLDPHGSARWGTPARVAHGPGPEALEAAREFRPISVAAHRHRAPRLWTATRSRSDSVPCSMASARGSSPSRATARSPTAGAPARPASTGTSSSPWSSRASRSSSRPPDRLARNEQERERTGRREGGKTGVSLARPSAARVSQGALDDRFERGPRLCAHELLGVDPDRGKGVPTGGLEYGLVVIDAAIGRRVGHAGAIRIGQETHWLRDLPALPVAHVRDSTGAVNSAFAMASPLPRRSAQQAARAASSACGCMRRGTCRRTSRMRS